MISNSERQRETFLRYQEQRSEKHSNVTFFSKHFYKDDIVLDIGCGIGIETKSASELCLGDMGGLVCSTRFLLSDSMKVEDVV